MKKKNQIIIAVLLLIAGNILLQEDYISFLQWWIMILCIGVIFMPLVTIVFKNYHDKGYLFSKSIGVAITSYSMWLFSSLHILKFTLSSIIICVLLSIILNITISGLYHKYEKKDALNRKTSFIDVLLNSKLSETIFTEELMFFAVFMLFSYIRGFKPEAYGTEKFMDYGFMTSMMRSEYMPPQDFWFSGTNLNYYYVGQFIATLLTKLSGVKVAVGYNLMLTMIGALVLLLSYSIVYNLLSHNKKENVKNIKFISVLGGVLASVAVCLAGNMHFPLYKWFEPIIRKFGGMEANTEKYWFPSSTRFIGYNPDTADKTIHEFPSYSFVLGDLHAHVINLIFVLTLLGLLFAWQCRHSTRDKNINSLWKHVFDPIIILITFFIGLFHMTNFWDFPIYYVVSGAIVLFTNTIVYNFNGKRIATITLLQGFVVILGSFLISLPFHIKFITISNKIRLANAHTPLYQMIILWGLPVFIVITFICFLIIDYIKDKKIIPNCNQRGILANVQNFYRTITLSDLYIITIGLCAIGLIIVPEVIYVEDIYKGYERANTMFKMTYQAFVMFGLCFGYIFLKIIFWARTLRQKKVAIKALVLFVCSVFYIQNAVNSWYGNIFNIDGYKGLDATEFMKKTMPDDELAISWINNNIEGKPVMLESPGDSYTDYERVSVMTGLPTVLGWYTHEWLWKSDTSILNKRAEDIKIIYTEPNKEKVEKYIEKYNISYIYVGKLEREKYVDINDDLLKSLGDIVFLSPVNETKSSETYIVKVNSKASPD